MKEEDRIVLEYLHILVSNNVIGDMQYSSRYKGFRGELEYYSWFRDNRKESHMHNGGYLIPTIANNNALIKPVYFIANNKAPDKIEKRIYSAIASLDCKKMFYFQYDDSISISKWKREDIMTLGQVIPVPDFRVFEYDNKLSKFIPSKISTFTDTFKPYKTRNTNTYPIYEKTKILYIEKLSVYNYKDLVNLYVERLFFDGYIGFGRERGIPTDIDLIVESRDKEGKLYLLEIKEKDLSKTPPVGFGMDVSRIEDINKISSITGLPYYYIVRHVNNQRDRKFIEWLAIDMNSFTEKIRSANTIEGGTGMRSANSSNPTKVCPYNNFKKLY